MTMTPEIQWRDRAIAAEAQVAELKDKLEHLRREIARLTDECEREFKLRTQLEGRL